MEKLNELATLEIMFEKMDNEIFAVIPHEKIKLTINTETRDVYSYLYPPIEWNENGDVAKITIRLNYFDENNKPGQEDRYLVLIFQKTGADWLIKELYNL